VDLPHTWNAKDGPAGFAYYRGLGTYSKEIFIDEADRLKRVFLKFEGANTITDVFVNDTHAGQHKGGYAAFIFELTDLLRYGDDNTIEVRVDNSFSNEIMPLSGDFNIYGGIYRPVHLIFTDKVCISPLDYASPGVYLKQTSVSKAEASVDVITKISNGETNTTELTVRTTVRNAENEAVNHVTSGISVAAGETVSHVQGVTISEPHLWHGRVDPYLYAVTVELISGNRVIDSVRQPLGLRYFRLDPEDGFYLNGEHLKLQGVSRHNDLPAKVQRLPTKSTTSTCS
jgi:beta-galactosidase